jgi:hypothetical protein
MSGKTRIKACTAEACICHQTTKRGRGEEEESEEKSNGAYEGGKNCYGIVLKIWLYRFYFKVDILFPLISILADFCCFGDSKFP